MQYHNENTIVNFGKYTKKGNRIGMKLDKNGNWVPKKIRCDKTSNKKTTTSDKTTYE